MRPIYSAFEVNYIPFQFCTDHKSTSAERNMKCRCIKLLGGFGVKTSKFVYHRNRMNYMGPVGAIYGLRTEMEYIIRNLLQGDTKHFAHISENRVVLL